MKSEHTAADAQRPTSPRLYFARTAVPNTPRRPPIAWIFGVALLPASVGLARAADFEPPIALRGVRLLEPGGERTDITIVMHEGRFVAVGPDVAIPPQAEVIDAAGLIACAGFIDAATSQGFIRTGPSAAERRLREDEPQDAVQGPLPRTSEAYRRLIHPTWRADESFDPSKSDADARRRAGFTTAHVMPTPALFAGTSALFQLNDAPPRRALLTADLAMHVRLSRGGFGFGGEYPTTIAGAIALFRQTLLDADWHAVLTAWHAADPAGRPRAPRDEDLETLRSVRGSNMRFAFHADDINAIHRALDVAAEWNLKPIIIGGAEAWRAVERLKATETPVVLSLSLPEEPKKPTPPKAAKQAASQPESQPTTTTAAASAPGEESKAEGDPYAPLFDDEWEKQPFEPYRAYEERLRLWKERVKNAEVLHRAGVTFVFSTEGVKSPGEAIKNLRTMIENGLPADAAMAALTHRAAELLGVDKTVGRVAPGYLANLVVFTAPPADKKAEVRWAFVEGRKFQYEAKKPPASAPASAPASGPATAPATATATSSAPQTESQPASQPESQPASQPATAPASQPAGFPDWETEIESDRLPTFRTGGNVLLRGVHVVTITAGVRSHCDLLIRDGRIAAIGENLSAPEGATILELPGYVVSPGIIDCHSHMALDGGLNEASQSVTPEVRMADIVDPRDTALYRALAGGVTMIHTMHGSANTIGGQNVVLRLKWDRPASELITREAPRTVKFALGENVKRSNSRMPNRDRFPASRMGVETVLRRSFAEARRYADERARYERDQAAGKSPRPVRRDLRLEALCDVMNGDIWVHCHCYRSDEMLRLLDVAEEYGFRVGVLQHVLEGYRVIPEIHRHGCAASTFSDWWAYKIEAYEAVPHNAGRMVQGGIVATVNSDSGEVVRHLNLEAAKSVRYAGLSADDALRLVTLNAAISLGVDKHVGSIEIGKLADLAIFDGHPLDTFARCVMTLVGGEVYFQHRDLREATAPSSATASAPTTASQPVIVAPAATRALASISPPRGILEIPQSPSGRYALSGATVHTISGMPIFDGVVVFSPAGIEAVGARANTPTVADATVIDATGLHVYPGLINAWSTLGLYEIGSVAGSVDTFELGAFQPDVWAASGVHPHAEAIPVTRADGFTSALVVPSGGTIAGRAALMNLNGWTMPEMLIDGVAPLILNLPSLPIQMPDEGRERRVKEHREEWRKIEEFFRRAKLYADVTQPGQSPPEWFKETDDRFEAMRPYVTGAAPIVVPAHGVKPIQEALRFAERYGLKLIISGGREAWKIADTLAEKSVPVIVNGPMSMPGGEFEPWDSVYRNAGVLDRAGVRIGFGGGDATLAKNVATDAGMAVAHGLDADRAVHALTLGAAEILGVSDRLGSIERGKTADLIVTTGHPCQAAQRTLAVFIDGRPMEMENKHTRLDAKFRHRPAPALPPARTDLKGPPPLRLAAPG